jgi:hypothetical protein
MTLEQAIGQLDDRASGKRKSAAIRLRRLADNSAGPALLEALLRETRDRRTWETQYQLAMALGASDYRPALVDLQRLALDADVMPAVYAAFGDAIVRLGRGEPDDAEPIHWCLAVGHDELASGALQAMALLRMVPSVHDIDRILDYVEPRPERHFWPAIAAAGWAGGRVQAFLAACLNDPYPRTQQVAAASLRGEYSQADPL